MTSVALADPPANPTSDSLLGIISGCDRCKSTLSDEQMDKIIAGQPSDPAGSGVVTAVARGAPVAERNPFANPETDPTPTWSPANFNSGVYIAGGLYYTADPATNPSNNPKTGIPSDSPGCTFSRTYHSASRLREGHYQGLSTSRWPLPSFQVYLSQSSQGFLRT